MKNARFVDNCIKVALIRNLTWINSIKLPSERRPNEKILTLIFLLLQQHRRRHNPSGAAAATICFPLASLRAAIAAARAGSLPTLGRLLDAAPELAHARDADGASILDVARAHRQRAVVEWLLQRAEFAGGGGEEDEGENNGGGGGGGAEFDAAIAFGGGGDAETYAYIEEEVVLEAS